MRYIVITSKHHDGFALFKSAYPFNIVDATPYGKDPIADLAKACLDQDMPLGFYYSQDQDWTAQGGGAARGHWDKAQDGDFAKYFHEKALPQLRGIAKQLSRRAANHLVRHAVAEHDAFSARRGTSRPSRAIRTSFGTTALAQAAAGDTETPEQHVPPTGCKNRGPETWRDDR